MEQIQQWAKQFASLSKRTPEGDYVLDESKFDSQAARSLIESMPDPASISFTIHERVAQFGAFGLYRASVTVEGERVVRATCPPPRTRLRPAAFAS